MALRRKKAEPKPEIDVKDFYSLDAILKKAPEAKYYVIFGEKSNGKTFAVKKYALEQYLRTGAEMVLIRRFAEDLKNSNGSLFWADMVSNVYEGNMVAKMSKGAYDDVIRFGNRWYLVKRDADGNVPPGQKLLHPFASYLTLATVEHNNTNAYPNVKTILFDEFVSKSEEGYLRDEFMLFQIAVSNIVRARDDVKVFLCGNTFNRYCPYFTEMGLTHVKSQKKGTIDVYNYADSRLQVAVEYSGFKAKHKPSDSYFAFDNPKLKMVTSGDWAFSIYPHLPFPYDRSYIRYVFFIRFDGELFQAELMRKERDLLIFVHRKTTPIKDGDTSLVYDPDVRPEFNYRQDLFHPWAGAPTERLERLIAQLFLQKKVFYQDNEVGDTVNNYVSSCLPGSSGLR